MIVVELLFLSFCCVSGAFFVQTMNQDWPFDPTMVKLLALDGQNFLFRGPAPLDKRNNFVYDRLTERMQQLTGNALGDGFQLVDISLLGFDGEEPDIEAEQDFFVHNPSLGRFVWWPLYGINATVLENACLANYTRGQ